MNDDGLAAARGICVGVLLGSALWAGVIVTVRWLL